MALTIIRVPSAVEATAVLTGQTIEEADAELAGLADVLASPSAQQRIAAAYDALPLVPTTEEDERRAYAAWGAFARETAAQWRTLQRLGFVLTVTDTDPYSGPAEMFADVAQRRIKVLSSAVTGGHPWLTDDDNDLFRAVHDVLGHAATGRGFDRHGEEAAYQAHASLFSRTARLALATETRGQNASMLAAGGVFPPQKVGILPDWARAVDALDDYSVAEMDDLQREARAYAAREGI